MSVIAPIKNGELVNSVDTKEAVNSAKEAGSLGKDDFLQLLVAEMKYQDPLEPTSNTDYVAQYAQFSQVEAMQNMMNASELQTATNLVGKYVTMNVTSAAGVVDQVAGRVDYVNSQGGKTYLYIDGKPYNYDNLDTVWDDDYLEATDKANTLHAAIVALPSEDKITLDYYDSVSTLLNAYNSLSEYEKSFISAADKEKLTAIGNKLIELKAAEDAKENKTEEASTKGEGVSTEGTDESLTDEATTE